MNSSHVAVHLVEDPPTTDSGNNNNNGPRVRMKDIQGMPGTKGGLTLRCLQFIFAAAALTVMATTSFCYCLLIISTLTFAAACASPGITVLVDNNLDDCAQNYCVRFEIATAMAFISYLSALPSFILTF